MRETVFQKLDDLSTSLNKECSTVELYNRYCIVFYRPVD